MVVVVWWVKVLVLLHGIRIAARLLLVCNGWLHVFKVWRLLPACWVLQWCRWILLLVVPCIKIIWWTLMPWSTIMCPHIAITVVHG